VERRAFYPPEQVFAAVGRRVADCRASGQEIDYVTFVPDGEPSLDRNLGEAIQTVRSLGIPVAVITNGSLLWRPDVRADLDAAAVVSVKVDSVDEATWQRLNRPSRALVLTLVLDGMQRFAAQYRGRLLTETMLVRDLNDDQASLGRVARFLETLRPVVAYLASPTRPPAEADVEAASEAAIVAAWELLAARLPRVELLTGDEGRGFGHTGDPQEDLLGILAVHPMPEESARHYLEQAGVGASLLEALLASGRVARVEHRGRFFVARRKSGGAP
jgi:wyosine [tRNA(Phe)-imidazoG37] synthetase (radical SAM superfamily)